MKKNPPVGVVMGSDSDWGLMKSAVSSLDDFGITSDVRVISAHRTPDLAVEYASTAVSRGLKVIIAAAGGAAHLGGILAAHTTLPVIGVPVSAGTLKGMDALLSVVQMPAGIPVATVTLGSAGPVNAAILAVQILAIGDKALAEKLRDYKEKLKLKVEKGNEAVQAELKFK